MGLSSESQFIQGMLPSDYAILEEELGSIIEFVQKYFQDTTTAVLVLYALLALQGTALMIRGVCDFVSLPVGIVTEGWPKGAHHGLGIVASILLVVFVTATSDYRQSLQFKDLDKEKT
nr:putative calcium-transporting atpase 7, plasma membrane-type [Quercus suber]